MLHAGLSLEELQEEYESVNSDLVAAEVERGRGKRGRKPIHITDMQHRVSTLAEAIAKKTAQQQDPQPQQPAQGQQPVQLSRGGRKLKLRNFDSGSLSSDEGEPEGASDSESSLFSGSTTSSASGDQDEAGPSKVGLVGTEMSSCKLTLMTDYKYNTHSQ